MSGREELLAGAGINLGTATSLGEQVVVYRVPGGMAAVRIWEALVARSRELQGWPLVCGETDEMEYLAEMLGDISERGPAGILASVPDGPPLDALRESRKKRVDLVRETFGLSRGRGETVDSPVRLVDSGKPDFTGWSPSPIPRHMHVVAVATGHGRRSPRECLLAVVSCRSPWEVPAYMMFGGSNNCPEPEIHVAFLRDWNRRCGAVPVAMTHDVLEVHVPDPAKTREEAWSLACEFQFYCPDIVSQYAGSVGRLAYTLWGAPYWYFWWD
jgi:hypothetical protein